MRVLLAHPPLLPGGEATPPLGLCTLASWLLHCRHDVRIIDLDLELKTAFRQPVDSVSAYETIFLDQIREFDPQVVGVTSMYSNSLQAEHLIRLSKRYDPRISTVAGGSHFGALGRQSLLRIPELDYVIQGEAESAFASLLDSLERGAAVDSISNLCYRSEDGIRVNPAGTLIDLAVLPPMWTSLDGHVALDRYAATIAPDAGRRIAYVEAGRGCPFTCTFCGTAPFWQRKYRVKPVGRIVDEIAYLHEQFAYDSFILVHDLLTVNKRFMNELCDSLLNAELPIEWMANSRTDIPLTGILPKMKAAGCWKLFLGIESASERVQHTIDKHLRISDAISRINSLVDHGISATCSFIIGFPDETAEELSHTIGLGAYLKLLEVETVQFHRLRLFPPSTLSGLNLPSEFDLESLRIEYPFVNISDTDLLEIMNDADFFAGYFTPNSDAGSRKQLAQVEMFFHHSVALLPMTIRALYTSVGESLVSSFYSALSDVGGVAREDLDWDTGDLYGSFVALQPLLETWLENHVVTEKWNLQLIEGLLSYETMRLQFISGGPLRVTNQLTSGGNWVALRCGADILATIDRLKRNERLTPDLLASRIIVLAKRPTSGFSAYDVDDSLLQPLLEHRQDITQVFGEHVQPSAVRAHDRQLFSPH